VNAYAGADGTLLRAGVAGEARGVVVAAFGAGSVTPGLCAAVAEAVEAGVPVLVVSRCGAGPTHPVYGGLGGSAELVRAGARCSAAPCACRRPGWRSPLPCASPAGPPGVAELIARL
jgi:L-asparaginase/Glu-tRNA(Gln) amidotransferase subunit D